jgi:hypothetical protein
VDGIAPRLYERRTHDRFRVGIAIVGVSLVVLVIAYISLSNGVDYVHGFGHGCVFVHNGWDVHVSCGKAVPHRLSQT